MPSLKRCEAIVRKIAEMNNWSKTPNVTLLESAKKILNATDKWRRNHPNEEVVREILEGVFFLLATCVKLNPNLDLDRLFTEVCKNKESFSFQDVPEDLVWSFILFAKEPYLREPTASQ